MVAATLIAITAALSFEHTAGLRARFEGVLDDAAFPAEERTTLSSITTPVLVEANASTGTAVEASRTASGRWRFTLPQPLVVADAVVIFV